MMPKVAPHGKTIWVEGMFSFEIQRALGTSSFMEGGLDMCCSSGPEDKNNWGEDLDSL